MKAKSGVYTGGDSFGRGDAMTFAGGGGTNSVIEALGLDLCFLDRV